MSAVCLHLCVFFFKVIANSAVQTYTTELWKGGCSEWPGYRMFLLFVGFVVIPPMWFVFSLPLKNKYNRYLLWDQPLFVYKLIFLSQYFQDTFRQIWMLPYLSYIFYDYTMHCGMYATISYIQRITFSILEWMDANDLGLFSILLIFAHNYINIFLPFLLLKQFWFYIYHLFCF